MSRPTWENYFMALARLVASRSTCPRKHVGVVLVKDNRVVATGYNGAPRGMPHCDEVGCELKTIDGRESCVRTLHAESNAIDYAGWSVTSGSILFTTANPCYPCAQRIVGAGIKKVYYDEYYQSQNTLLVEDFLVNASVELVKIAT